MLPIASLRSADVTVIDDAGHTAWIDDRSAFGQALTAALNHHTSGDPDS